MVAGCSESTLPFASTGDRACRPPRWEGGPLPKKSCGRGYRRGSGKETYELEDALDHDEGQGLQVHHPGCRSRRRLPSHGSRTSPLRGGGELGGWLVVVEGGGAGRTERRDTPPRLSPLTGRWQAAARPRHCRSAPRRASRLRGRPWRAGGGKAGRRRREAAAQPGRAAAATPRGEEGKPSHRPPPMNGGLAARRRPEPAAPLPVMVLPGWRSRPAGPKLRRAVVKRGGAARSRRALRRPRCPGRGGPPPAKLKAAAAPPPPRSHPPPPCPEGKGGPGGQSLASPAGEAIPALPSLREPPPPGPAVGLRLWCKRRDR